MTKTNSVIRITPVESRDGRIQWALALIDRMSRANAFGKLTVSFENGRIVHVQETVTYKPPEQ